MIKLRVGKPPFRISSNSAIPKRHLFESVGSSDSDDGLETWSAFLGLLSGRATETGGELLNLVLIRFTNYHVFDKGYKCFKGVQNLSCFWIVLLWKTVRLSGVSSIKPVSAEPKRRG